MPETSLVHTAESLVARLRELAATTGRDSIPEHEFRKATGISAYHVMRALGSYGALRQAAGLKPQRNRKLDTDTILRALRDACLKAGTIPPCSHIERFGAYTKAAYYARWGDWRGTRAALRRWLVANDPGFPYLSLLPEERMGPKRPVKAPGAQFGAPLNFGPLLHEPTNEQGVVVLFGSMAMALGFSIERIGMGFPDCEAKQRVSGGWRRVRIEFEYRSRNFERHGHDAGGCDLIVCWEHDWADAPVEVIELRAAAKRGFYPEAAFASSRTNELSPPKSSEVSPLSRSSPRNRRRALARAD